MNPSVFSNSKVEAAQYFSEVNENTQFIWNESGEYMFVSNGKVVDSSSDLIEVKSPKQLELKEVTGWSLSDGQVVTHMIETNNWRFVKTKAGAGLFFLDGSCCDTDCVLKLVQNKECDYESLLKEIDDYKDKVYLEKLEELNIDKVKFLNLLKEAILQKKHESAIVQKIAKMVSDNVYLHSDYPYVLLPKEMCNVLIKANNAGILDNYTIQPLSFYSDFRGISGFGASLNNELRELQVKYESLKNYSRKNK